MESISGVDVKLSTVAYQEQTGLLHVSVCPPKEEIRKACALICIVDISGSMGCECKIANTGESVGYSTLELVKHSLKTVVNMLGDEDYLALVPFTTTAEVLMNFSKMTEVTKKEALSKIEKMEPTNSTNLWDGLKVSMDLAKSNPICKDLTTSLWLFTDGQPDNSRQEIMQSLFVYLKEQSPEFTIHTFGFGYSLDSQLLYEISEVGHGINCYLPDCNLVGTTFVNCLCNILSTAKDKVKLEIKSSPPAICKCIGYPMRNNAIEVGTLLYGQTRDFIIQFDIPKGQEVTFTTALTFHGQHLEKSIKGLQAPDPISIYSQLSRSKFNEIISDGLVKFIEKKGDASFLKKIVDLINFLPSKDQPNMKALLADLESPNEMEGRVGKAFSTEERMQRWGAHYVRSIIRAHQIQQCHNFKDPGVQVYGGQLFKELQKKADTIFCSLPPPTSSIKAADPTSPQRAGGMQTFNDCSGGCFDGEGEVMLANGLRKKVKNLLKGDEIIDSSGVSAKVVCLVVFPVNKVTKVVNMNGMKITPKHPVKIEGEWKYPKDVLPVVDAHCDNIYNLVLDKNHVVCVNGNDLVTLGHEKCENEVIQHPYYGTRRVISDLKDIKGWNDGKIEMAGCHKLKDPLTGAVMAIH